MHDKEDIKSVQVPVKIKQDEDGDSKFELKLN